MSPPQSIYEKIPGLQITIVDELKKGGLSTYQFSVRKKIDSTGKTVAHLVEIDVSRNSNQGFSLTQEHFDILIRDYRVEQGPEFRAI